MGYGFDSHCHLDYLAREGLDVGDLVEEARLAGIERLVSIATSIEGISGLEEMVRGQEGVYMSVGQHPCFVAEEGVVSVERLREEVLREKVVGIGETGLDFYRTKKHEREQRESFANHIRVSRETGLPLVIHSRSSNDAMLEMLSEGEDEGDLMAIWHCFDGDEEQARRGIDLGMYISFSGLLTYEEQFYLREIASRLPIERILVETDSPYLLPSPLRGEANRPSYIVHTEKVLSEVCGLEVLELRELLSKNFERIFWKMGGG